MKQAAALWVRRDKKTQRNKLPWVWLYDVEKGVAFDKGKANELEGFCYPYWLKFTGVKLRPGQLVKIRLAGRRLKS